MNIIAIFANSPFDQEIRIDCEMIKVNTKKEGDICILPNYNNTIFDIDDTIIEAINQKTATKIKINGSAIIKFENNNFLCLGAFEVIQ